MSKTEDLFRLVSDLVEFRDSDWDVLEAEAEQIRQWGPEMVNIFYDTLFGLEETRQVFHEGERPKVEATLATWIESMISGKQGPEFWEHQWLVALMHIKRGTKNLYMLGMMNRLQQVFLQKCMEHYDAQKAIEVYSAFLRISGTVATLIAQCYDEVTNISVKQGLARVGLNEALVKRIRDMQIETMMKEVREKEEAAVA